MARPQDDLGTETTKHDASATIPRGLDLPKLCGGLIKINKFSKTLCNFQHEWGERVSRVIAKPQDTSFPYAQSRQMQIRAHITPKMIHIYKGRGTMIFIRTEKRHETYRLVYWRLFPRLEYHQVFPVHIIWTV